MRGAAQRMVGFWVGVGGAALMSHYIGSGMQGHGLGSPCRLAPIPLTTAWEDRVCPMAIGKLCELQENCLHVMGGRRSESGF